jgi:hypothetical protein
MLKTICTNTISVCSRFSTFDLRLSISLVAFLYSVNECCDPFCVNNLSRAIHFFPFFVNLLVSISFVSVSKHLEICRDGRMESNRLSRASRPYGTHCQYGEQYYVCCGWLLFVSRISQRCNRHQSW